MTAPANQQNRNIDVTGLQRLLDEGRPVTVLDVRSGHDRAEWSIPGSIHVDAYRELASGASNALAGIELPHDQPVITVCRAGNTSMLAAEQLRERGIHAQSLTGGMNAWSMAWNTAEVPIQRDGTTVIQIRRTGKGCLSYLIGSDGEAAVIDASLDPQVYVSLADRFGWTITLAMDTHIHADHLSRTRALAERAGAALHMPAQDRATYRFSPLDDGDVLRVGRAQLVARRTPGHTLESMTYVLDGHTLFTGDTLFLGGVGRPDLEADAEQARIRTRLLYRSLQGIDALPGETRVLPGHTSSPIPFDGKPFVGTVAETFDQIDALRLSEDDFADLILSRIPPTPPNHSTIVAFNEAGDMPASDPTDVEAGANRCAIS